MARRTMSGIMLTLLILSMLTYAFNVRPVKTNPITLTVIGPWSGTELDKFIPVLEAFEISTGINVTYNCISSYELVEILPEMFEAETAPGDVIFVWPWFIREIGPQGHAVNVTSLINEADFRLGALDQVKVEGTLYGGAYTGKAKPGFWYRKSFFEAHYLTEPTTWEEFIALLETISGIEGIVNPIVSGDGVGWPLSDVTEHFLITFGGPQLQRDLISGEAKWERPPVRTIFEERLVPLLEEGYFSMPIDWIEALELWWAQTYGLYFMGSWITGMVDAPEDLGVFSLPGGEGLVFGADYFFIPTYTEYPDEAQQLFQFLASADAQEIQVAQGGHIATNIHVPLEAYPPVDRMVAELMEGKEVLPDLDDAIGGEFQTTFWEQMQLLWVYPELLDEVLQAIQAVAPAKTWYVPTDFPTIQEAINAATDRDTIFVHSGIYHENVIVNKSVSLVGEDIRSAIVDGIEQGHVFNITRDHVSITGFTIRNSDPNKAGIYLDSPANHCTITGNNITNNCYGIHAEYSSNNTLSGNNIINNSYGVYLFSSWRDTISGNNITNSRYYGILLNIECSGNTLSRNFIANNDWYGIYLGESSDVRISGNYIVNNDWYGIFLHKSSLVGIYVNYIANNDVGIMLQESSNVDISGNDIRANNVSGVSLVPFFWPCENNSVYHNNFISNTQQVYIQTPGYTNFWDDGYPSGGNYWSDYTGVDFHSGPYQNETGSDGIGDTRYVIDGENWDNYPLMDPYRACMYVDPLISYAMVGEAFRIDVKVADVTDLYGFEFVVGYNTSFLDAMEVIIRPFLNEPTLVLEREINEEAGFVRVAVTSQYPAEEVYGSGTLASIFFQVIGFGECLLDLYDTKLSDPDGFPIDHSVEDGFYEGGMTQVVSTESPSDSQYPSVAVGSDDTIHIAWNDWTEIVNGYDSGTDIDVFYKRYVPNTGWTDTEVVSTESTGYSLAPSLGVDSDGTVHIAWYDNTNYSGSDTDYDIFYKRYVPNTGWTDTEVVSTESTGISMYPSLGVGPDGTVHVAWYDWTQIVNSYDSGTDADVFYKRYVPNTGWTQTEVVSTESTDDSKYPSLGVNSNGIVHVAWDDHTDLDPEPDADIFYKRYVPNTGWTQTEVVSTESTGNSLHPSLGVGPDGTVHIAWYDWTQIVNGYDSGTDVDVFYKTYVPNTGWTQTEVVSTESTSHSTYPSLGVSSEGTVHIAWEDLTDCSACGTDIDIFYKRHEAGWNWTFTQVVSTESTGDSYHPSLAVDLARNVHIAWHDETDYAGCGSDADIFYKYLHVHSTQYPWPMFHHNPRHTGYTESPAPRTNKILWKYTTGGAVKSSPAVVDAMVFVGSNDNNVCALDQDTGAHIWKYTTGGAVESSPAVADGKVYVGSFDGKVYCLDAATGAHIWNHTIGSGVYSSPAVADGKVYVGSFDGKVYCLDASNGTHIWNYTTGASVYSSPAVADGKVFVGSNDGNVYALDQHTGAHIWNYPTGGIVRSSPAVVDGKVYVGSLDRRVYCLDASNGTHIWNYTTGLWVRSSPAVADGKVYVGSHDGKVYCLDASNGTHIWNYTTGDWVWSSPAVADGKVYVGSLDNKTYCLDASTGAHIWNYTTGGAVYSSPAVADGMVFVGSNDNTVYAFGDIVRVPEDYPTVQDAIDAADPGATISIAPGTYYGASSVAVINKSLTLLGRKGSSTTFAGGGSGIAVNITNTCQVTITNIEITYWDQGIYIDNSSECNIYNNVMYLMDDSGVVVEGDNAANNVIYNNVFQDNNIAIDLSQSSTGNIIYANTISQNNVGINALDSTGNTIYCNSFINNGQQVNMSSQPNAWDNGSMGNYWDDYTGTDANGDGIGDTPYIIDANNRDNYPLMSPYEYWNNPILGDINKDMKVDYKDLLQLAAAYGSTLESLNWNPNCDLNKDYKVEVLDLFNLGKNYGKIP